MVVFRLTQEDIRRLQAACSAPGSGVMFRISPARNCSPSSKKGQRRGLEKRLHAVEQQLLAVQCTVQNLLGAMDERVAEQDRMARPASGDAQGREG